MRELVPELAAGRAVMPPVPLFSGKPDVIIGSSLPDQVNISVLPAVTSIDEGRSGEAGHCVQDTVMDCPPN